MSSSGSRAALQGEFGSGNNTNSRAEQCRFIHEIRAKYAVFNASIALPDEMQTSLQNSSNEQGADAIQQPWHGKVAASAKAQMRSANGQGADKLKEVKTPFSRSFRPGEANIQQQMETKRRSTQRLHRCRPHPRSETGVSVHDNRDC